MRSWVSVVSETLAEMERMRGVLGHLRNRQVSQSWNMWMGVCNGYKSSRSIVFIVKNNGLIKALNALRDGLDMNRAMKAIAVVMRNGKLKQSWTQWWSIQIEFQANRGTVKNWLVKELGGSFRVWIAQKEEWVATRQAMLYWSNQSVAFAMNMLVQRCNAAGYRLHTLRSSLQRLRLRNVNAAFISWSNAVGESRQQLILLKQVSRACRALVMIVWHRKKL